MHGMIMVVYLLTALFLGGFGNYLIPLQIGARDMVFPFLNMLSYWFYLLSVIILAASFFVAGGPTGAGWTLYPPQAITEGTPGAGWHSSDASLFGCLRCCFYDGRVELRDNSPAGQNSWHDSDEDAAIGLGYICGNDPRIVRVPGPVCFSSHDGVDHLLGTSFFMPAMISLENLLSTRVEAQFCSSTCFGSLDILRFISSLCQRLAWCLMC